MRIGRDRDGEIVRICNETEYWSPRAIHEVIKDIETNFHSYFVQTGNGRVDKVVTGPYGKRLATNGPVDNALETLPEC